VAAAEQELFDSLAPPPPSSRAPPPRDHDAPLLSVPVAAHAGHAITAPHRRGTNPVAASFAPRGTRQQLASTKECHPQRGRFQDLLNSSSDDFDLVAASAARGPPPGSAAPTTTGHSRRQQRRQQRRRNGGRAEDLDDVMGASGRMIDVAAPVVFSKEPRFADL